MTTIDVERLRQRFPTLARKIYLNSGSYGLLADEVRAAFNRYLDDRIERGADWEGWVARTDRLRGAVARLINAGNDEIAITASASAGINAIASALDFTSDRNKIVVSNFEFPTSGQIWHAQARRGARIEHVTEAADGYIPAERFASVIDDRTRLVAIAHVCYRNGARLDVEEIVRIAHSRGALVLLDCFQSLGAVAVDVKALGVDFAVGGMLKYLLGTAGIGYLYADAAQSETLVPTASGWFAQDNANALSIFENIPAPNARRFQAGTPPVPNCYAAEAGINLIQELGPTAVDSCVRALTGRCMDRLTAAGFKLATPREDAHRGPQVAIRSTNDHALVAKLAERNIIASCRDGNLRAMFHVYNNDDDVSALLEALEANRGLLV